MTSSSGGGGDAEAARGGRGGGSARRRGCGDERGGWGGHREGGGGAAHTDRGKREAGEGRKGGRARLGVAVATAGGHVVEEWPAVRDRGGGERAAAVAFLCARARGRAHLAWTGGLLPPPPANKPDTRVWQRAGLAWQQAPRTGMGAILTLDLYESRATRRPKRLRSKVTRGWLPTPSRFGGAPPFAVSDMPRGLTQDHQRLALPAEGVTRPAGAPTECTRPN